ncbi:hypothetical protein [Mycolicibacterium sp. CR10]|uniref:hypothetical protein n=1 Tax=Mycolicibacterium sp. CR10 TaxID=2562314 RepID=UPI0010C051A8|nr:hypothetical protein [Mycolicibacterium sp. CR10]
MARERLTRKQISAWRFFYFPLIIGLVIGTSAASATDQWWWAAVGAVAGAAIGEAVRRSKIGRAADDDYR